MVFIIRNLSQQLANNQPTISQQSANNQLTNKTKPNTTLYLPEYMMHSYYSYKLIFDNSSHYAQSSQIAAIYPAQPL